MYSYERFMIAADSLSQGAQALEAFSFRRFDPNCRAAR